MAKKKKKDKQINIACADCDTKSIPDCGKCRLIKKHDLVSLLTEDHIIYLKESNRNNEGRPRTLTDDQEHYLAIFIHLGETMESAGLRYGVSKATAQRIYAKYKGRFPEKRKIPVRKKMAKKSS